MAKLISNNKLLAIINVIFIALVIAQEMEYIDVFPVSDAWKKFLKTTIALVVAVYNYYKLNTPKNV
mgnify:CR=1 FL=1